MKTIIIALAAIICITNTVYSQAADSTAVNKEGIQTIQVKTSAVCDMCKETLEKAMAFEKGVKDSNLDVDSKVLTVKYDPKKTSPEKIKKAITLTGYDADEMPADSLAYEKLHPCCRKDVKH
jgi:mercuric ion binding protein